MTHNVSWHVEYGLDKVNHFIQQNRIWWHYSGSCTYPNGTDMVIIDYGIDNYNYMARFTK